MLDLGVVCCSIPHENAVFFGMGLSWRICATSDMDGLVTELWKIAPNFRYH